MKAALGKEKTFGRYLIILVLLFISNSSFAQYDIEQFFYRGRQSLIDGKYAQAIDNFNILTQLDTISYDAYFFRGVAKYNLGDYIGAEQDFDKALKINPLYTPAYHYRAITLSRTGKYDLALKDLAEAVDLRPSYTGLYFSRGVTYFLSQQFDKAIQDFNRFIKNEPKATDAYLNRGASYLFLGDTTKALDDYNRAIKLDAFDPEGFIRRSRIYSMQKKHQLAIEDLDRAIKLDTTNSFAFFNRAIIKYEGTDINGALSDLNKVLELDPGNALTLYNRALIRAQIGDYNNALDDYDRVISVNPNNVLAYFNRAGVFLELKRYRDAMNDYSQAINLYPDFAKAYMNRSYAKYQLGQYTSAKKDEEIALAKVREYKQKENNDSNIFADTTKKYNKLLALDADFAKKDFNNELLQHRDVDIRLKPLFKFNISPDNKRIMALEKIYENKQMDNFISSIPIPIELSSIKGNPEISPDLFKNKIESMLAQAKSNDNLQNKDNYSLWSIMFAKALIDGYNKQFNNSLDSYNKAIELNGNNPFMYINRGVLQAETIDFISSMENNVQILSLDNSGTARARVQDKNYKTYDYTSAIHDMNKAANLINNFPFIYYNLGNLYCLSQDLPESINQYTKAINMYPSLAQAYYNRGLVLIYLKDKEKGCIDLSKAGELGITEAYSAIKKYCKTQEQ